MKVSLVTISFNQAQFLERTISSVLDQNYANLEYIVVDPGSTDGSREIIAKYADRIQHVILEPDVGAADGLNKGFAVATGDILGFLNSDDTLQPGALDSVAEYFKRNTNTDVVSGHAYVIDENDFVLRTTYSDKYSTYLDAYGMSILVQPSTFFRSETFAKCGGFNKENRSNWDGELFYRMALNKAKFDLLDEVISSYRIHSASITGGKSLDDKIRAYGKRKFTEIMGREWRPTDVYVSSILRLYKHLSNPKALFERVRKGPVYGCAAR